MLVLLNDLVFEVNNFYKALPDPKGGTIVVLHNPATGHLEKEKTKTRFNDFRIALVRNLDETRIHLK